MVSAASGPVKVIVVGAGPAGLMAAGQAAGAGASVTLLEGGDRPGRKLLLTGRGRCNLTNTLPADRFCEGFGPGGVFLRNGFHRFFSGELREFLDAIGVATAVERGGRVYPSRGGAAAVVEALVRWIGAAGVRLLPRRRVLRVLPIPGGGLSVEGDGFAEPADRVVVAAGGASWPATGSRGDGYRLAAALGIRVVPPRPALVPVVCSGRRCRRLAGLRLRNVRLTARPRGRPPLDSFGEVHFTPFGVSGPAVFPVSEAIGAAAAAAPVPLEIDLKPGLDPPRLEARLLRELGAPGKRSLERVLATLLPVALVPELLAEAGLEGRLAGGAVGRDARRRVLSLLKGFPLEAVGTLPVEKGMVTAGGIDLHGVDPRTMESRAVPGLHFAGEVLDLAGDTGGYNLQAAFTTGFLAGVAAAAPGTAPAKRRPQSSREASRASTEASIARSSASTRADGSRT